MAFRQLVGVLRSLVATPGQHLSNAAAAQVYASSALLRRATLPLLPHRPPLLDAPSLVRAFSRERRIPARSANEVLTEEPKEEDLNLEEPTGIFHIYDREEPNEKDEDDPGVPWGTISLAGPPPEYLSLNLSQKSKNAIYERYTKEPTEATVAELASEFKILKQRVQAIICLKEREEKWEKAVFEKQDEDMQELLEDIEWFLDEDTVEKGGGERLWLSMARRMKPKLVVENDDFEADSIVSTSGMSWDEASRRYEEAEYKEFSERLKYNKRLSKGELKTDPKHRKKPAEGWSYMIEELGKDGKRGKGGGRRFVANADGTQRPLNDLEKLMMKRETPKRRKFDFL